ncbi:hypothetical protein OIV83_000882 [Microbotryomycetes sp. JL201]|nr:hypothetical protein OIV83_000882 [Microbotryomycetes sp. JL201]
MQPSITLSTAQSQPTAASGSTSSAHSSTPSPLRARELSPPTSPSPGGRSQSPARRSLSPGPPTTAQQAHPTLSPRSSRVFASRPSPVVPSPSVPGSPASFSRPTSPRPHQTGVADPTTASTGSSHHHAPPHSPTQAKTPHGSAPAAGPFELSSSGMISRSASNVDLSHVFERDVEFASTHRISAQEAVDVAIAPVLDEAAVALTSSTNDLTIGPDVLAPNSGWSSPVVPSASAALHAQQSRSPTRAAVASGVAGTAQSEARLAGGRSLSPDSASRAASPGSSTSFSIGTPPDDSAHHPFTQHLSDALERERKEQRSGNHEDTIRLTNSATDHSAAAGQKTFAPLSAVSHEHLGPTASIPGSPSLDHVAAVAAGASGRERALSFTSYADVINEERLAELTGAPAGGEQEPAGHTVDLAGVLDKLELSGLSISSAPAEST